MGNGTDQRDIQLRS